MRFAHFADCHIGGWKSQKLRELNLLCFRRAVALCLEQNVDFVLLPGDLFNTALPPIDYIKAVTEELQKLKDAVIPVYMIAGSHDFSASGKTMLDVFSRARLIVNVMRYDSDGQLQFTQDQKTGAKIVGVYGKKGGLEKELYKDLDFSHLEAEDGFKIFLFHTAISEFTPKDLQEMQSMRVAQLPKDFSYYAGGHVHYVFQKQVGEGLLTFPGALFPNSFKELEEWKHGGVYIVDEHLAWEYIPVKLKDVQSFSFDLSGMSAAQASEAILSQMQATSTEDAIVTLRLFGTLSGDPHDIAYHDILAAASDSYAFLKHSSQLQAFSATASSENPGEVGDIEAKLLAAMSEPPKKQASLAEFYSALMQALSEEKVEGETVAQYQERFLQDVQGVFDFEDF